jgi:hypothetical protein
VTIETKIWPPNVYNPNVYQQLIWFGSNECKPTTNGGHWLMLITPYDPLAQMSVGHWLMLIIHNDLLAQMSVDQQPMTDIP